MTPLHLFIAAIVAVRWQKTGGARDPAGSTVPVPTYRVGDQRPPQRRLPPHGRLDRRLSPRRCHARRR
jgi:hypothetical protein